MSQGVSQDVIPCPSVFGSPFASSTSIAAKDVDAEDNSSLTSTHSSNHLGSFSYSTPLSSVTPTQFQLFGDTSHQLPSSSTHHPSFSKTPYDSYPQTPESPTSTKVSSRISALENEREKEKPFRQLPCKTFLSCGTCPFSARCVFLHDIRLTSLYSFQTKTRKKAKDDETTDCIFFPPMSKEQVGRRLDSKGQPHIGQPYIVPHPSQAPFLTNTFNSQTTTIIDRHHSDAMYSLVSKHI